MRDSPTAEFPNALRIVTSPAVAGVLIAAPPTAYQFTVWSEGRTVVSNRESITLPLAAAFVPGVLRLVGLENASGWILEESTDLQATSWMGSSLPVSVSDSQNHVSIPNPSGSRFFRLLNS